jgi:hypothetical protein
MDGPEEFVGASGRALPELFGGAVFGVHASSTSKPPVIPVLSTVNQLTNGALLVASCAMEIAFPNKVPGPILVTYRISLKSIGH